jgi:hypothetical protein
MKDADSTEKNWSRRSFLRTVGASVPTLSLMVRGEDVKAGQGLDPPRSMTIINSRHLT